MNRVFRRPSPAMVVAIVALIAALGGSAIAGGVLTKKKVNKIITKRAPGLSVARADAAATAQRLASVTVQRESFTATSAEGGATASCPAGQQAIGGGVRVTTGDEDAFVTQSRPVSGGSTDLLEDGQTFDGWRGNAIKTSAGTASGSVWAICAG